MVREFGRALPGIPIALADMRDLSRFRDAEFDFALASNNVFDAVGHGDRLRTLTGIHRLLRPGGILMFSSHNRDVPDLMHWPRLEFTSNPFTLVENMAHWCLSLANHTRLRHSQVINDEYAIINDRAHDCSLLQYYIGPEAQRRQLEKLDFKLLEILDRFGAPVPSGDSAEHSRRLLYVARRLPVS
jgi:SAM-dependent methyltransferase